MTQCYRWLVCQALQSSTVPFFKAMCLKRPDADIYSLGSYGSGKFQTPRTNGRVTNARSMNLPVFKNAMRCFLEDNYQHFGGMYCFHPQTKSKHSSHILISEKTAIFSHHCENLKSHEEEGDWKLPFWGLAAWFPIYLQFLVTLWEK
jgi:hypothetical protein